VTGGASGWLLVAGAFLVVTGGAFLVLARRPTSA
jgi:hypothetical protein